MTTTNGHAGHHVEPTTNGHVHLAGPLSTAAADGLPRPTRTDRWQPLRVGLLNLYRFDHEEFHFERGRLLLRGNNGTGKSRVLALTLPFLLDGELSPHRLEPDQDNAKRPEWNLLMGRHDDRLGYTWIEFGLLDGGQPRYLTLGCGMRAVRGKGIVQRWYFTADQRVGGDLRLVGDAGQALTRNRLEEAIGGHGHVHDTAKAYRHDVDRRLFDLGERRYEALVELLIALRRPQLSRQLDEGMLSDALSEALPPLPQQVVDEVAQAFRTLENDRDQLASFTAAASATRAFLDAYQRYAAIAVRRRVKQVTSTNSTYETTQRSLRGAEADRDDASAALGRIDRERRQARDDDHRHAEEVRTLETSPAMDRARELEHAREDATAKQRLADEAVADVARAAAVVRQRADRVEDAAEAADETRERVRTAARAATDAATAATLGRAHESATADLDLPDVRDHDVLEVARRQLADQAERRTGAIVHVRDLVAARDREAASLHYARTRLDEKTTEFDAARDDERDAAEARDRAVADALTAYRQWARECTEVHAPPADDVAWQLEAWSVGSDAPSPVADAVEFAVGTARDRLASDRAGLARRSEDADRERTEAADERDRVADARHLPPPAPHTRDAQTRDLRPGAPLWQLVEVADGIDPAAAAGYEAALEAAGLLDAWVTPDGQLLDPSSHDTAVLPAGEATANGGLGRVLVPSIDPDDPAASTVSDDVLTDVLARIGAAPDAGEVWVAQDGRFRIGPLHGSWTKPAAEHLGHAAREGARRRQLAELDARLAELDAKRAGLDAEDETLRTRAARLAAEVEQAPSDTAIRTAEAARVHVAGRVTRLRDEVASREQEVASRVAAHQSAERGLAEAAGDLGLGDAFDRLDDLADALAAYREALARLWPTLEGHGARLDDLDRATADHDAAAADDRRLAERADDLRAAAIAATSRRDTLETTVGVEVEQLLAQLEEARHRLAETRRRLDELGAQHEERRVAHGIAETRIEGLTTTLAADADRREDAIGRLAAAVRAGLLAVACVSPAEAHETVDEWSADRAVRTARRLDQQLDEAPVDDGAWSRTQQTILAHFSDLEHALISHDLRPAGSFEDELFVVTTTFQGQPRPMPDLRDLLADEVESRQALLSAREREIIENHLIGDVAALLHDLLRAGEVWVTEVNEELARMPTSTGMQLRFVWQPRSDGPTGLREARSRMLAHHAGWSPAQRQEVGAFLQERISEVREADDAGTWQQHLAQALDYRAWHRFVIERRQDGEWKPLTRRTHGTGSGGEKALALTVPQFAAAAAHYRSAGQRAPRLIMLDEAFVGIDAQMRANCMGLLEQFDLDLIMTSEREWGCYPTVPGLAIAQLATRPGIDAIGVSRWIWNGRERVPAHTSIPSAATLTPS